MGFNSKLPELVDSHISALLMVAPSPNAKGHVLEKSATACGTDLWDPSHCFLQVPGVLCMQYVQGLKLWLGWAWETFPL